MPSCHQSHGSFVLPSVDYLVHGVQHEAGSGYSSSLTALGSAGSVVELLLAENNQREFRET